MTSIRSGLLLLLLFAGWGYSQPMAALRLAHMSPDAPRVDLVIDRQLFLRDVPYGQITSYMALPAGQHEVSVYPHRLPGGQEPEQEGPRSLEPLTMLVDLDDGMYYTLAISGFYQRPSGEGESGSLSIDVDPGGAAVQVDGPRGYSESFAGEGVILRELEPGSYSVRADAEGYLPAVFEIEVRPNETATVSISLQEGEGEDPATATGARAQGTAARWRPLELHAFRDGLGEAPPPGGSRIRLIHLSPSTTGVDLLALPVDGGGEPITLASGLTFPNGSTYARVPGREFTLQVRLAGSDAILSETPGLTIDPGAAYTLFLVREPADNYLRLIPAVDMLLSVRR